jgi:tetratricopeptide (TPR) repeat protein/transcriptional regulator with XRE-family HTH domain
MGERCGMPVGEGCAVRYAVQTCEAEMTETGAFGAWLRSCRQSAGLSQEALAGRAGLSVRAVRNLERGRTGPHSGSLHRLADALELRDEARGQLFAAAGRQLAGHAPADVAAAPEGRLDRAGAEQVVPRELPGPVRQFVGRASELAALTALLGQAGTVPEAVLISAIGGTAGVGKTALAVRWAHQIAERFPDGQLYVNLRGYDPDEPLSAADALVGFLRDLGVPGPDIPAGCDERAARFRSLLAGRRMLVVLDNAAQAEQVRPLLPGSPGCVTLVTSRDALAGLVAKDGAVRLDLDLLPPAGAVELLRALIGARVDADPAAAYTLAARCARLPLALRVAAELATARPAASLAELAGELADQQERLNLLDAGGDPRVGIRAVFSWSYNHLGLEAARLFRLISLHPGPSFDQYAAAALTGNAIDHARRMLDQLSRAHLINAAGPGRYAMHDLLRAYARELARAGDSEQERDEALTRLTGHYLHAAATAMDILFPAERHRRPRIPAPARAAPALADVAEARAWLDAQLANLVAAAAYSAGHGWPADAIRLSATLSRYLTGGGHFPEAARIHSHARAAARTLSDHAAEAAALSHLSQIDLHHGHAQQAASQLQQALELFGKAGDRAGQARALHNLATVEAQQGRYQQAGEHHQQALELYLATGDRAGEARALHGLADMDLRLGRYQHADGNLQRALALCQQTGDWVNEAYILALIGDLNLRLGRYRRAARHLEQALGMFREAEDRIGEAWVLAHLGAAQLGLGHGPLAAGYQQQARSVACENKDRFGEAEALNGLGEAYLAVGQPGEARAAHIGALDLATQTGDKFEQARAHAGLARTHQATGDRPQALDNWHKALAIYDDLGTPEAGQIRPLLTADSLCHHKS